MLRIFLSAALLFLVTAAFAADYKINATKDKESPTGVYIPTDLEDCFKELKKMLPADLVEKMKSGPEKDMIKYHHGLGTWLRNNWGLWAGSRLRDYFKKLGLAHLLQETGPGPPRRHVLGGPVFLLAPSQRQAPEGGRAGEVLPGILEEDEGKAEEDRKEENKVISFSASSEGAK
jgi:hypothetical protein